MIEWLLPLELVSPNKKEHWALTHKRNKRNAARLKGLWMIENTKPKTPCVVLLERMYCGNSKPMDIEENLPMAFKGIKDALADLIVPGLAAGRADDAKHGISWQYLQSSAKITAVKITIKEGWLYKSPTECFDESLENAFNKCVKKGMKIIESFN